MNGVNKTLIIMVGHCSAMSHTGFMVEVTQCENARLPVQINVEEALLARVFPVSVTSSNTCECATFKNYRQRCVIYHVRSAALSEVE